MAIDLTTAGILVKWAVESTAGTRPTTGYAELVGVKSIPESGGAPNTLQTTVLKETVQHTYTMGLKDSGGAFALTVNDNDDFRTSFNAMYTAYETAKASGKALWIEYYEPGITGKASWFFSAIPAPLSFGGAEVDAVLENTVYFVPTCAPINEAASS